MTFFNLILVVFHNVIYHLIMDIEQLVKDIVTHLTQHETGVRVEEDEFGAVVTIVISGNVPSLIGKNGTTVDALRTLLKAIGYNGKHRIKLRINESA